MNKYIVILCLILSTPLFAQKEGRFQVGLNLTPNLNFKKIDVSGDAAVPRAGLSFGANASYYFKPNLSLETGINMAFRNYRVNNTIELADIYREQVEIPVPDKIKYFEKFQFLEAPVTLNYFSNHKKIRLITSLGISTNFFLNYRIREQYFFPDRMEEVRPDYNYAALNKRVTFSPLVSVGIDYKISNNLSFRIQPTARFNIQEKNSIVKAFSTGINFGTYYRFSK